MSYGARMNVDQTVQTQGSQGASRGNKGGTQRGRMSKPQKHSTSRVRYKATCCAAQGVMRKGGAVLSTGLHSCRTLGCCPWWPR